MMFKALSNHNRLRIFQRLVSCCGAGARRRAGDGNCACVGELGRDLGIAPSTVSHHIKELRQAGLIRVERRGQYVECWADPEALGTLARFLQSPALSAGGRHSPA